MLVLSLLLAIPGIIFAFRWGRAHKFEYLDGVKPSEQLDKNFWCAIGFMCLALALMLVGLL